MTEVPPTLTPEQAELAARKAQRWSDPATERGAQERLALINVQAKRNEPRTRMQLTQLQKAPGIKHKIYWLRELAQTFGEAVAPHAACTDGCSGCCYQPVALTLQEAEVIARETGAQLQMPASWSTEAAMQYVGQPCPFLRDGRCSIYRQRPMVCRLIFSMDTDALLCQNVPGVRSQAPYADHSAYKELYVRAHVGRVKSDEAMQAALKTLQMADLREFFPHGLPPAAGNSANSTKDGAS